MDHCPLGHLRVLQILDSQILEWVYKGFSGLKILTDKLDLEIKPFVSLLVSVKCIAAFGSSLMSVCTSLCVRVNSCPEQASICMGRRFGEPQIWILFPLVFCGADRTKRVNPSCSSYGWEIVLALLIRVQPSGELAQLCCYFENLNYVCIWNLLRFFLKHCVKGLIKETVYFCEPAEHFSFIPYHCLLE